MKTLLCAAAVLFPILLAAADPEPEEPMKQIRFDLLIVSVPEVKALELRAELQDPARIAGAQEKLLKLVAQKQATLIGWPTVTTKSGQRCVTESVMEMRYPTEFQVPAVNVHLAGENPDATAEPKAPDAKKLPKIQADVTAHGGVPAAFEKRDAGVTFEIEPTISPDGQFVDMQLQPQHVQFLGLNKITFERKVGSDKSTVEQPTFFTTKVSTNITVKSGSRVMLSFEKIEKPVGNIEIMILQTTIEAVGQAELPKRKK